MIDDISYQHTSIHTVAKDEDQSQYVLGLSTTSDNIKYDPPSTVEIIHMQQKNTFRRTATIKVRQSSCTLTMSKEGLSVKKEHSSGAVQLELPVSLRWRVLTMSHHHLSKANSGLSIMCNTVQRVSIGPIWPLMS